MNNSTEHTNPPASSFYYNGNYASATKMASQASLYSKSGPKTKYYSRGQIDNEGPRGSLNTLNWTNQRSLLPELDDHHQYDRNYSPVDNGIINMSPTTSPMPKSQIATYSYANTISHANSKKQL